MAASAPACLAVPTRPARITTGHTPGKRAAMAAVWSWQPSRTTKTCTCTPAALLCARCARAVPMLARHDPMCCSSFAAGTMTARRRINAPFPAGSPPA